LASDPLLDRGSSRGVYHVQKLIAIAATVAIGAAVSVNVTKSEHTSDAERAGILMPSIAQMMSDAKNLPVTPLASP
jgi:hypothetical protein